MNRGVLYAGIVVIVVAALGGAFLFNEFYIKGGTGEASQPLAAPELSLDEDADDETMTDTEESAAADTEEMADEEETDEAETEEMVDSEDADEVAADEEMSEDDMADEEAAAEDMVERQLYRITPDESQVMFEIDELLAGAPKHVVGTTDQVAGDIIVDMTAPENSELGPIVINARTFTTDNDFRNRAIRSQILQSADDAYEFITFTPTALTGLPEAAISAGDEVAFQIVGDLQIRDITTEVTFEATVVLAAEDRLEGSATTVVQRDAYNLTIPEVPRVSDVAEEVPLTITFVALAVTE